MRLTNWSATTHGLELGLAVWNPHAHDGAPWVSISHDISRLGTSRRQGCWTSICSRGVLAGCISNAAKWHETRLLEFAECNADRQAVMKHVNRASIGARRCRQPKVMGDCLLSCRKEPPRTVSSSHGVGPSRSLDVTPHPLRGIAIGLAARVRGDVNVGKRVGCTGECSHKS